MRAAQNITYQTIRHDCRSAYQIHPITRQKNLLSSSIQKLFVQIKGIRRMVGRYRLKLVEPISF